MIQKSAVLSIIFFISIFINSCTTFKYPLGVCTCEELGITLDFDDNDGMGGWIDARGEIITDEGNKPIICLMSATSAIGILYSDDLDLSEDNYIYYGNLKDTGKNRMTFTSFEGEDRVKVKYEFIKQE